MVSRRRWVSVLLASVLALAVFAGCGSQSQQPQTPAPSTGTNTSATNSSQPAATQEKWDGTLKIGLPANPTSLDPRVSLDGIARAVYYNAYNYLVIIKPGTTSEIVGDLAESWEVSPDGKEWTFILKEGPTFEDGTPVDSAAVKFTFESMMALNQGPASDFRVVEEIQTPDDRTVKFMLSDPFAIFPSLLVDIGIVNPKVMEYEENGDYGTTYLAKTTMGSGPYKLTEWKPNEYVVLEAVPNHWGEPPKAHKVIFPIFTEVSNLRLQLEKGDLDIAWGIPTDQVLSMFNQPGIRVAEGIGFDFIYVYLNNQREPFNNVKVRQALSYATDYETIVNELLQGHGRQLKSPFAYGMEGYEEPTKFYTRDVEKAKALLAEAGYEDGFTFTLLYASPTVGAADAAKVLQANWAEIGVTVKLQEVAEATRRERVDTGDFEAAMGQWIKTAQPYWTMNVWHESDRLGLAGNRSFYLNEEVDALIRTAAAEMDLDQRSDLYRQAADLIIDDAPYVYLYQRNSMLPMREELQGHLYNPVPYRINIPDLYK